MKARLQSTTQRGQTFYRKRRGLGLMGAVTEGSVVWVEDNMRAPSWLFRFVTEVGIKTSVKRGVGTLLY